MEELNQSPENIEQENVVKIDPVLGLTPTSLEMLAQASKWSQILAIISFVFIGFMSLGGIFSTILFSLIPKTPEMEMMPFSFSYFGLVYLIIAAVFYFPANYLLQFSNQVKKAIQKKDDLILESSFRNLKSLFKFYVIYIFSFIGIYILSIIGFFIFLASNFRQYQ